LAFLTHIVDDSSVIALHISRCSAQRDEKRENVLPIQKLQSWRWLTVDCDNFVAACTISIICINTQDSNRVLCESTNYGLYPHYSVAGRPSKLKSSVSSQSRGLFWPSAIHSVSVSHVA
jgi:hypothetical protein